jgi:general secretion pathway protein G
MERRAPSLAAPRARRPRDSRQDAGATHSVPDDNQGRELTLAAIRPSRSGARGESSSRGFTLLEIMVVIAMIVILLAVAVPIYNRSLTAAKEATLHKNLVTMNAAIDHYTRDKKKGPQSLDELKRAGYIEEIPQDITGRTDTWVTDQPEEDTILYLDQTEPGITSVHSGSDQMSSDGTAYSSW